MGCSGSWRSEASHSSETSSSSSTTSSSSIDSSPPARTSVASLGRSALGGATFGAPHACNGGEPQDAPPALFAPSGGASGRLGGGGGGREEAGRARRSGN